jgi:Fe-S-cluster containining protein
MISANEMQDETAVCRACGACCSFSREWPRFSLEDDADLDRIPRAFVDDARGRMRCNGNRCSALVGDVGVSTSCAVYAVRPDVCRACLPGDDACQMARRRFNMTPFPAIADRLARTVTGRPQSEQI